ncbi:MAG: adenosylcobinamide-GDP ribazoletransferase [Sediminimonas qiaohouensis]|uniref:Adenosylcobinamide-GDP ribazoletransferase n=1 Tax=Sediminimonas qiaohouensis TaxID=552061 RepID=A0A7C9HAE5_9RHOB|nr:adenosylcobinamide-GDP ribazoletransferase [Sediminimonas qiaohouensis]MTJ04064.1 adenosylcobinamide-GDP ribazoletransferase [Sediminimonas qiaohouensis]
MHETDPRRPAPVDIGVALALLTRLPITLDRTRFSRTATAVWAYPLAGLIVAVLAGVVGGLAAWAGLPAPMAAGISLLCLIVLTGAMHEDGLADSADGFWGGWDETRRLEIMKDSHIGTYGVIALVLSLGARWGALGLLWQDGAAIGAMIAAAVLSRGAMPAVMAALPHARADGLSRSVGRPDGGMAALAAAVAVVITLFSLGFGTMLAAVLITGALAFAVAWVAAHKIGGQTGDILGACQQLCEIAVLWVLCI